MKRFAIILVVMVFTMIGCANISESEPVQTSTTPSTFTTESRVCVEHDFSEATLLNPRECLNCDVTEGEPLYVQCETWDDVVGVSYFGEYSYDWVVTESNGDVFLKLNFNDITQFSTEDSVEEFMSYALVNLVEISGFVRGNYMGVTINTPDNFRVNTVIFLNVPGGSINCIPSTANMFGIKTIFIRDKESQNADILERVYNSSFGSLGTGV